METRAPLDGAEHRGGRGGVTETMVLDSGLYVARESIAAMLQIGVSLSGSLPSLRWLQRRPDRSAALAPRLLGRASHCAAPDPRLKRFFGDQDTTA